MAALVVTLLPSIARADIEPFAESVSFVVNTSTPRTDTDADGLPDNYEIAVGLNPFLADANDDADGDGLTNIQEYNAGSSPFAPDSSEFSQGVSAVFTFNARTTALDTDGDGMPDDWESAHGLNPLVGDGSRDEAGDFQIQQGIRGHLTQLQNGQNDCPRARHRRHNDRQPMPLLQPDRFLVVVPAAAGLGMVLLPNFRLPGLKERREQRPAGQVCRRVVQFALGVDRLVGLWNG